MDIDRYEDHRRGFWDENLVFLPDLSWYYDSFDEPPILPDNIKEMIKAGEVLSKDFPHTRVDFYNVEGKICFGEITFYANSGYGLIHPDCYDNKLGSYFTEYG